MVTGSEMDIPREIPREKPRIGFVGAGRVGSALSRALARKGERVAAAYSRSRARAEALAAAIPGCDVAAGAQEVVDSVDLVFLTVPDDAIAALAASLRWRPGAGAVHCSGACGLEVLAGARAGGAGTGAFHPLQLFSDPEVAAQALSDCAIAVEASAELRAELERLVGVLGARLLPVPPGARAAYHAASHYAAAFVCVLLDEGEQLFRRIGIDGPAAGWALLALARGTLQAVAGSGPQRAMAGAYARGDMGTAARHLQALDALGPDAAPMYRSLARRSVALALAAGRIDAAKANAMQALLDLPPGTPQPVPGH